jgi:hypothetical protein
LLKTDLNEWPCEKARVYFGLSVENDAKSPSTALYDLVTDLNKNTKQKVVNRIDEYDGPIVKALNDPDFANDGIV